MADPKGAGLPLRRLLPRSAAALCLAVLWTLGAPSARAAVEITNTVTLDYLIDAAADVTASESDPETGNNEAQATVTVHRTASATTQVDRGPIAQVPALSPAGLVISCLLLAATALAYLRRPRHATRLSGGRRPWRPKN
jgi:hypothetical protein